MDIMRLNNAQFANAYGIRCSRMPNRGDRDGIYPTFCRISIGEHTMEHAHYEPEIFYIISGNGVMSIDGEFETVCEGDLIRIPPFSKHELRNTGVDELVFISIYSEDSEVPPLPSTVIMTAAPPTPNGPLHIGHISGPYLASDIITRHLRQRSVDVHNHSGTDDHQNYVFEKARLLHMKSDDFRNQMHDQIQRDLLKMSIEFDEFIEPKNDDEYKARVYDFVRRAIDANVIEKEHINLPYCEECDLTLVDALIDGICPSCHSGSRGVCENCGIVTFPSDLLHVKCARCHLTAQSKSVDVYTFSLSKYLPDIQHDLARLVLTPRVRDLAERVMSMKNHKLIVTHPDKNDGGLRMPDSDSVLHVWFEMAAHYEQFSLSDRFWISCFGFDNSFYYLLFIPSILRAMNKKAKLPDAAVINDFLLLDGEKFSTSREHAIWVNDLECNIDYLRLYLIINRPVIAKDNFSLDMFQLFSKKMVRQMHELNQRAKLVAMSDKNDVNPKTLVDCNRFTREMECLLSPWNTDLRRAGRLLLAFMDFCCQSMETDSSERLMLHTLAMTMLPFMPNESHRLLTSLGEIKRAWMQDWTKNYAIA